ncbi:hypothetical protein BCR44DRAFT_35843 [Catenaria anguillulae PL171]|uniref:FAD-binding FR-type domain-containing protein n=1 Tax=Catenaria anguillulae PL171 TaxID=765915 RepID=A0A1Y2HSB2_9FUNG|nr:hypothetical protein BCR44DRAFT_35843 [Catenaria anguillulae PL171]
MTNGSYSPMLSSRPPTSRLPAVASLSMLAFAFTICFWRDIVENAFELPTKGGLAIGLTWTYDGVFAFGWAIPVFLSVLITLFTTSTSGYLRPAFSTASPERTVQVLRYIVYAGNLGVFACALIAKYGIPVHSGHHHGHGDPNAPKWTETFGGVAGRGAMPAFWNVAWSLITAMRYPALAPLQASLGLAYEHTVNIHRLLGWMTTFWLVYHSLGYMFVYLVQGNFIASMTPGTTMGWFNFFGSIGTLLLVIMAITSLSRFRRANFTLFTLIHWLWIPFFILSLLHIPTYFLILLPSTFLYLIDRLACLFGPLPGPLGGALVSATAIRVSDESVALLIPVGPARSADSLDDSPAALKLDAELTAAFTPGRFLCLAFASDAPGLRATHPFSIAAYSVPNRTVAIMIRALGPWTRRLHALATADGARVELRVAGPCSVSALAHDDQLMHQRVVVAGGVGVSKYLGAPGWVNTPLHIASAARDGEDGSTIGSTDKVDNVKTMRSHSSGSVSTVTGDHGRKVWMCKDTTEFDMYAALGADLAGWEVYSRKFEDDARAATAAAAAGDAAENAGLLGSASQIKKTYPLFAQTSVYTPSTRPFSLGFFALYLVIYLAFYFSSRYTIPYDPALCARVRTLDMWLRCSRGYGLVPFAYILVGLPIVIQVAVVAMASVRSAGMRAASVFYTHAGPRPGTVVKVGRRFDLVKDAPELRRTGMPVVMRSCTSKQVRNGLREQTSAGKVVRVDDSVGF